MNAHVQTPVDVRVNPVRTEHARHRFTVDDVMAMTEAGILDRDARIELMDGELIDMPSEGELHVWFKVVMTRALVRMLSDDLYLAPDATLSLAPEDHPEPDFYIFESGTPLTSTPGDKLRLIIEISDTSLAYDLGRKSAKYASYGVGEYWVIDVRRRCTHVMRAPENGTYLDISSVGFDQSLTPSNAPGVSITMDAVLAAADYPGAPTI